MDLSEITTLRVGGPADDVVDATTDARLIEAAREAWAQGVEVLPVGGGSNLVVSDEGYEGTVIRVLSRGVERIGEPELGSVLLRVQAGEPWDALVALAVENGWAGIEALSGIPGSCGAAPIQNIGAYGYELASTLVAIEFLDRVTGELEILAAEELGFGYRTSSLKRGLEGIVVSIDLRLTQNPGGLSSPIEYPQLTSALAVDEGTRLGLPEVRRAVLELRASKGMVLDPKDPDSVSAGSFFTNPIVSQGFARGLPADSPRWPNEDGTVKLSAAWLIEHSGIGRGFRLPGSAAAVSSKHTLALVNLGAATASEIGELARYIQARVLGAFGVNLQPEPVLIGIEF